MAPIFTTFTHNTSPDSLKKHIKNKTRSGNGVFLNNTDKWQARTGSVN